MPEELRQIGELAEATGFCKRTIRHYEEVGLVVPARTSGGSGCTARPRSPGCG